MEPRAVAAAHGWTWITQGYALFRKSPAAWVVLLGVLFLSGAVLLRIPLLGIVFVLLTPVFIAGLMEGCSALERGEALELQHLLAGFRRNAAPLVTVGGVMLLGNVLVMMIVVTVGGETLAAMMKAVQQGAPLPPQTESEVGDAVRRALLVGIAVSLPLLMAVWYAPMLVHFHGVGPLAAMRSSFVACVKNALALVVYGSAVLAGMLAALTAMLVARGAGLPAAPYDLALWLLTPIVLPSLYASYKDVFLAGTAPARRPDSVAG